MHVFLVHNVPILSVMILPCTFLSIDNNVIPPQLPLSVLSPFLGIFRNILFYQSVGMFLVSQIVLYNPPSSVAAAARAALSIQALIRKLKP